MTVMSIVQRAACCFLICAAVFLLLQPADASDKAPAPSKPNIILIYTDDVGIGAVHCTGGPFFVYYPMSHAHAPILPTPDSKPGADKNRLYADNIEYMDKLVGRLMAELDRMPLREKTLVVFTGDNGTASMGMEAGSTVDGRPISGQKGEPRDWVYVELDGKSYVRDSRFKLANNGEMFDLSEAPFVEKPVATDTADETAIASRVQLQKILDEHPAAAGGKDKKLKKKKHPKAVTP